MAGSGNVKRNAVSSICQKETVTVEVKDNWTANRLDLIVVGIARAAAPAAAVAALEEQREARESTRKAGDVGMRARQRGHGETAGRVRAKRAQDATEN
jgi:hypothetical protein